jgi:hypothetical protein
MALPLGVGLTRVSCGGVGAPTLMLAGFLIVGAAIVLTIRVGSGGRLVANV